MRRSQPSSDLLMRQRYCITTGRTSCCSGDVGPTGPVGVTGPAGPGVTCAMVYSGITTESSQPIQPPYYANGTYWFQITGSALHIKTSSGWNAIGFSDPIYFLDTVTNKMYYVENDDAPATLATDEGLIIGCRDHVFYNNVNGVWEVCCNITPMTSAVSNASFSINSATPTALITSSIVNDVTGTSAQLSASVYLNGIGATGQGYLYLAAAGVTGTKFPYTVGPSFPDTYTVTETFKTLPNGTATIGLYGYNTGVTATGGGNLSALYNLSP